MFNLTFNIIIFSLIILSILTALIYVFAGQISDPIRQVTQMTKQISKGIFSTRLSVESSDETGILADSVNKMSENLQRALIDLSKEKNKAVAATIAKSNFLANMSHEIRTPMNSVLGYAQLIARSSGVDSQVQEYVKRIELSGKHLLDLINTILDLSKIESGKSELNESSFDLTNLCNDLTSMFEFRCKEKGLEWIVETNFDQVFVYADKLKLQQILINLLNNAIKFTQQGHIKLKVSKLSRSKFYFEVIDTGRGISEEGKRKIFEPFHQQFENDQLIGSGLGLTIATNLIKDMGSSIHVDSELGKGSRFWFEFQLKPVSYEVSKSKQATTKQLKGVALVVDDIKDNREIIKCLLQDSGIEVLEAEDGKKAVELVKNRRELNQPLDYIFMDILMPTMSGEEAFNQIKNMNIKSNTKIYAVSASTLTHEKDHILSLGFDGFLAKPVTYEEIESIVHLQKNTISEETEVEGTRINTGENDSFVVPEKVIKEGIEACKIYHISKLTDCIEQIEQLGGRGVSLSEQLRAYLKDLNMEAIEKEFAQIKTVKGSFNE